MSKTTLSSREFNQHASEAKKAANRGPVFITDRGKPAHVLLCMADYLRLQRVTTSLAEQLAMPDDADIKFEPARSKSLGLAADFDD